MEAAKRLTLITHDLVWLLLLVIPYVSTDQVSTLLDPASNHAVETKSVTIP